MKSCVIVFPGSNCDRDIAVAKLASEFKEKYGANIFPIAQFQANI